MNEISLSLDLVPSITKDLDDQKAAKTGLKSPVRRKTYVPPVVDDLGSIEATTFQTSFRLG